MNVILETERLILRELTPLDALDFYELNADPEVIKYTGNLAFLSVDEAKAFLENYTDYKKNGFGRWAVIGKKTKSFLGWCGLKLNQEGFVDLGYRFYRKEWGKGYATESAKASMEYGFENLGINEIIGRVTQENVASVRVLEKLGMVFWKLDKYDGMENVAYYRAYKKGGNNID